MSHVSQEMTPMWAYLEVTNVNVCDIIHQLVPQRMDWCGLLSVVCCIQSVVFSDRICIMRSV